MNRVWLNYTVQPCFAHVKMEKKTVVYIVRNSEDMVAVKYQLSKC